MFSGSKIVSYNFEYKGHEVQFRSRLHLGVSLYRYVIKFGNIFFNAKIRVRDAFIRFINFFFATCIAIIAHKYLRHLVNNQLATHT